MDFIDALRVLGRRWRIVVVGMTLMLIAGVAGILTIPTTYQSAGQLILLLPSQSTGPSSPTNPFLNLQPGLTVTASLIASTMTTQDAQRSLRNDGFTSEYSIALNPGTGPVLQVSTKDTDGDMAVKTRNEVITRLQDELQRIQVAENAPQRQFIHGRTNSVPNVADALPGSKIRALAVIGALGTITTLIVAFLADRRRRSSPSVGPTASESAPREPHDPVQPEHLEEQGPVDDSTGSPRQEVTGTADRDPDNGHRSGRADPDPFEQVIAAYRID